MHRDILRKAIVNKAFRYSPNKPFTLTSGNVSPFYFDCKKVTLDPECASIIGVMLNDTVRYEYPNITGAGGLTLGADPMSYALSHIAWKRGHKINPFIVRKEPKGHGTKVWIEGNVQPGDHVVILDDVVTTGGSAIKAVERAKLFGLQVDGVILLIDRQEFNGIKNIQQVVPEVSALFTREELLDEMRYINA